MDTLIAGIDEAGRGPLAGPVVASAVILNPAYHIDELADSKTLTEKKRAFIFEDIMAHALCVGLLEEAGPDADIYALLGVIQQARHLTDEARQHLERALYLAPNHHEALFHLLLLHQERGDEARALVLRRRLERNVPES